DTSTPIYSWDVKITGSAALTRPVARGIHSGVMVVSGSVSVRNELVARGEFAVLDNSGNEVARRSDAPSPLRSLAGDPIAEPLSGQCPFVMNSREEIENAYQDFRSGKMGTLTEV